MAPSRSNYAVLPEPVLMEDRRRSWNRGSSSGLWLMGALSGLALLLTTALVVKTYVLNPHSVAHSHLGDGKVNKFDISQIHQIRPSPENDCYGDPSYWHEESFQYCCETAGTGPGCQSMKNNDDLDRFSGPGFDAPEFEGSYNPSYQSGSYDPTDSVGAIGDGYPPEIVSHEVIDEDGPFQKSDPYADFEQPDPKEFHPKEAFIDCTSPKDTDTMKKLEICCHHGSAGCDILAAKKAAKKAAEEKESEEKRKKKEKEEKEKEEKEKKEREEKEKKEREEKEKKEREEKEKKEREEKEKKAREEKEKKEREEREKKEEKPKEEKEEKPKKEKEEKQKEEKEEKPKEEKEEKPKKEKEEKPKEEKEKKETPKPPTPEQPKPEQKPAEEKNEESSKDKTEKPEAKATETKLKVKKAEKIGTTTAIPATTLKTSTILTTTKHVPWYDRQSQVVWPTFNRLKLK